MSNIDSTVVITANTGFDKNRLNNFYLTNIFQGIGWMMFHFAVVFFFTQLLGSLALVGIFLGISNFVAFLLDIPLGILQRYISTKKFFIIGVISQLVALGIFFVMIMNAFGALSFLVSEAGGTLSSAVGIRREYSDQVFGLFSENILNWVGLFIAAICYGLTKEMNDVSTFWYILSNAKPDEYGIILSRSNITFGVGSIVGLWLSGIILGMNNIVALIILGIVIFGLLLFTIKYFDNSIETITMNDVKEFTISVKKMWEWNIKEKLSETISGIDLQKVVANTKYLFLKPKQQNTGKKIPWGEVMTSTKKEFVVIWEIIGHSPIHYALIWGLTLVLIFGFWDTFASSFLIDFLDNIAPGWGYMLLAAVGVPGIVLQEFAIKAGQKFGDKNIGLIGLALSAGSLIFMGILASTENPGTWAILGAALINSLGYACGMAIGQNVFLDTYNKIYAEHENLKEIDANASAGPMKVVQNLANVIGLVLGWFLIAIGFNIFFFIFALVVIMTLAWTIMKRKQITI